MLKFKIIQTMAQSQEVLKSVYKICLHNVYIMIFLFFSWFSNFWKLILLFIENFGLSGMHLQSAKNAIK